jgi:hypothetical protein
MHPTQPSCNLFVAGLLPTVDDRALEKTFGTFGHITSAKVMVDLHTAKSRRFGFVLFDQLDAALAAQCTLHDKATALGHITVQFSTTHSTAHLIHKSDSLYVRNIPKSTPAHAIRSHFETFGTVVALDVLRDTAPGASGQFVVARIVFASPTHAAAAERVTQCGTNAFSVYGTGAVPPLLAKLAEKPAERARRLESRRTKDGCERAAMNEPRLSMIPLQQFAPLLGAQRAGDPSTIIAHGGSQVWTPVLTHTGLTLVLLLPVSA